MQIIRDLSDKIEEELEDACSYIDLAFQYKTIDQLTAELYATLSAEEMGHADKLHARVKMVIEAYRKEKGEPPKDMLTLYNYLHEKQMEKAIKIKVKQALFKEGSK